MFVDGSYVVPQIPVVTGVLPARGMGDAAACGANPCSWWDESGGILLPFFMSANCQAYLACAATGAAVTPDPSSIWTLNGGTGAPDPAGGGVPAAQAACTAGGNTWNPLTSTCVSSFMTYVPWVVAGLAVVLILPPLLNAFGGRR